MYTIIAWIFIIAFLSLLTLNFRAFWNLFKIAWGLLILIAFFTSLF